MKGKAVREISRELYEKFQREWNLGERMALEEMISLGRVKVIG